MKRISVLMAAVALAGCAAEEDSYQQQPVAGVDASYGTGRDASANSVDPQQARMTACMDAIADYRARGVVEHGGARPGVNFDAWSEMNGAERQELFETAACIQAGGLPGPQEVEIVLAGTDRVIGFEEVMVR